MKILHFSMSGKKYPAPLFLWCLINAISLAQVSDGISVRAGLQNFTQEYSCAVARQEHIFVSVNSGVYYPGESIMFKALLLGNDMKIKTDGSRFFYLQLIDYAGKNISNYAFELHEGECSGHINIPSTLHTGIYTIRAYTRWMLNFGADNFFERPLMIVSPLENTVLSAESADSLPVRFYPQCGRIISGVNNKILVRLNPRHQGQIQKLKIIDNKGNIIDTCRIDPNGTGIIYLTPEAEHVYYASDTDPKSNIGVVPLPECTDKGFVLQLSNDENSLKINVCAGSMQQIVENLQIVMLSESTGKIINLPVNMNSREQLISIPLANISEGLHQILLFEGQNTILSQSTWYKKEQSENNLIISVNDTLNKRTHAKSKITVSTPATKQKLSAAVIAVYNPATDSLLFNELGYLKYFSLYTSLANADILPVLGPETNAEYINNLLTACLNTRITDFLLHDNRKLTYVQEIKGISLSGKVINLPHHTPVSNAAVLLSYPDSTAHFDYTYTDKQGEFNFVLNNKLYGKQVYLIIQDRSERFNPVEIIINDPFVDNYPEKQSVQLTHPVIESSLAAFQNISLAHRVFYQNKNIQPVVLRKSQLYTENFYGKPDFTLIPAEFESLPNIYEIRKNLIAGIKFDIEHDIFKTYIFDPYLQLYYAGPAFVMLNNIPFPSLRNILELNSDNIRKIELKRDKFFYDNYLMFGIMTIYTKTPVSIESSYCYKTVTTPSIIESSEIQEAVTEKTSLPDIRHTLLWKTNQLLTENFAEIPFKTPDIKGSYRMKVLYIAPHGRVVCCEKEFYVQ